MNRIRLEGAAVALGFLSQIAMYRATGNEAAIQEPWENWPNDADRDSFSAHEDDETEGEADAVDLSDDRAEEEDRAG
jgi:hypothetical protein